MCRMMVAADLGEVGDAAIRQGEVLRVIAREVRIEAAEPLTDIHPH